MITPDNNVRIAIQNELMRSVIVEASAGTGKTTLLTNRVKTLVEKGVPLKSLAIVTFTEAAASELRCRIREILSEDQVKVISQTWITTIHGFASKILREYFHLCKGAPEFSMETTHFSETELAIHWDIFLSTIPKKALQESAYALNNYGSANLLEIAKEIEKHQWLTDISFMGDTNLAYRSTLDRWEKELVRISLLCTNSSDVLLKSIVNTVNSFNSKPISIAKLNLRGGTHGNWGGKDSLKEIKAILKEFNSTGIDTISSLEAIIPVLPAVEHLVFPFVNQMRKTWFEDPTRLSFDDLLHKTWQAISTSSVLRKELNNRFAHIFIDEFQDTSLVQVKLFTDLLEKIGLESKITVVGDPKQSIFGWRSADIETYKDTLNRLESLNALSETISVNFRSAKSIINFINPFGQALFNQISNEEIPFSCSYSPIVPSPDAEIGEGVTVHYLPDIKPASEIARIEAEYITTLIKNPTKTAILFRTGTRLDALTQALDQKGITYKVEASRDFKDRQEVIDTATILKAILNPSDEFSLLQTYRSIFFGISDIDITKRKNGIISDSINKADILIEQLRISASNLSPFAFIQTLFANTCLLSSVKASGYQISRRLANLRHILETAYKTESYDLLLEILTGCAPISADEPSAPPENDTGAVTLTTIHRAKGLAWEHVILTNPGAHSNNKTSNVLVNDRAMKCGIKVGNGFSAYYTPQKKREIARSRAEFRRLLYVAVTRPKTKLDILLPEKCSELSPAGVLNKALNEAKDFFTKKQIPENLSQPFTPPTNIEKIKSNNDDLFQNIFPNKLPPIDIQREQQMQLGTEVHNILEFIDFSNPEEWIKLNKANLLKTLCYPKLSIEYALKLFKIFDLTNAEILGREFPLILQGKQYYIDLLIRKDDIIEIIDYKTDLIDSEERVNKYRDKQLLYKRVIEETYGGKIKTYLVFLRTDKIVEIID